MKIAVLLGGLRFESQRRIVNGILDKAAEDKTDVYIFSCESWTYSSKFYERGETSIFSLPNFRDFDGVILHGDTVYDKSIIDGIVEKIREAEVPAVSLNINYPGLLCMGMDNVHGIYEMTTHLIKEHHASKFAFIAGPENNHDSVERYNSFYQALQDNGIAYDDSYFYFGDYHPESGKKAIDYFYSMEGSFPNAIVAANDEMAIGAYYALKEKGYEVPGDVLLTGYDNNVMAQNHQPKITSIERAELELGERTYEVLVTYIQTGKRTDGEILMSKPVYGGTCGCHNQYGKADDAFRTIMIQEKVHMTSYAEIIKSSSADFTGAPTFEQLIVEMKRYLKMINPEEFYLCMGVEGNTNYIEESLEEQEGEKVLEHMKYAKESYIPVGYRYGTFVTHGRFQTTKLLPEAFREKEGENYYTIVPLHYLERCFGYCVLGNCRLLMDSGIFHLFIMNINNALENLRKQSLLNAMVHKLNKMWIYDTLTEVFNRAGFFKFAPNMISEAREKGKNLFILFMDLDGLKHVNDTYGHDEGDIFIREMAAILKKLHGHGELLMRYGGDEFVVMTQDYSDDDAKEYMKRIQASIDDYNHTSGKPYQLSASMGYHLIVPDENMKLETLIDAADQEMYKTKKRKKQEPCSLS